MPDLYLGRDRDPLDLWVRDGEPRPGACTREFEYTSRGDRVTGALLLPARRGPHSLVLVQHALGDCAAGVLAATDTAWVEAGAAVAAIDFPLHGGRADAKLLALLTAGGDDECRAVLAAEFAQQAVTDLERAIDAIARFASIDAKRIGYVGFGLGGQIGSVFCALDPRPGAAVLAPEVGAALPAGPDPAGYVPRIAPRPVLRVEQSPAAPAVWDFLSRSLALRPR